MLPPYLKRIVALHRPYAGRLVIALVCMMITAAVEPAIPWLFQLLLVNPPIKHWTGYAA